MKIIKVDKIPAGCICALTKENVIRWAIKVNGKRPTEIFYCSSYAYEWWCVMEKVDDD